ncbi:methyltransferase TRM13-domain-containing protein [Powellomyces hirtus]|nr:methyltransferase TRM13-domain-containing protein [Powellomyces hirtus]
MYEDKTRPGYVEVPGHERVPCPYDGGHNVAAKDLEKHMRKCNNKPEPIPLHFVENINVAQPPSAPTGNAKESEETDAAAEAAATTARERLFRLPRETFTNLVSKVQRLYAEVIPKDLETMVLTHPSMNERLAAAGNGKHAVQQASLLGHIDRLGLLEQGNVFVEFGAGKGELAKWIYVAVGDPSKYVLIDRRNFRQKFDANMKHNTATWIDRLSMDIKDLDLTQYARVNHEKIVAVSKHLCGAATDLTLRCIANYQTNAATNENTGSIEGIVIALCCHHICKFAMYADPEYLQQWGISEEEFESMCVMSSWGTCGTPPSVTEPNTPTHVLTKPLNTAPTADDTDQPHWTQLTFAERETLGLQCKRVLDYGRLAYLRRCGFEADLVYYVDRKNSLENLALVAKRKNVVE